MKKLALHWKIMIGMAAGIVIGSILSMMPGGTEFVREWIKPWGTMFINSLKLIAIPLILVSLIKGVSDMSDISQLSSMGTRTLGMYLLTTLLAVTLGLTIVNIINPGYLVKESTRNELMETFGGAASGKVEAAAETKEVGRLQPLVDIIPDNIFNAASSNGNMLQVIFFAILLGIGLILIDKDRALPVKQFFDGLNDVIMKIVDLIMLMAPYGVLALMATLIAESPSLDIFIALGAYALSILIGLAILGGLVYPLIVKYYVKIPFKQFFKAISPAQLLAFSTSSSAATLPVTMERVEEHLGVRKDVASFVCPVGATINMDGTSLYQAVAAVFISQAFGDDVTLGEQITIVLTATLASIGSAAVPGAGLLMLVIVLESIGVNPAGIALIFAIDRPLDMCRTIVNVTSDATVALVVAKSLHKIDPVVETED
jgi:proton glutamate symport protein